MKQLVLLLVTVVAINFAFAQNKNTSDKASLKEAFKFNYLKAFSISAGAVTWCVCSTSATSEVSK